MYYIRVPAMGTPTVPTSVRLDPDMMDWVNERDAPNTDVIKDALAMYREEVGDD